MTDVVEKIFEANTTTFKELQKFLKRTYRLGFFNSKVTKEFKGKFLYTLTIEISSLGKALKNVEQNEFSFKFKNRNQVFFLTLEENPNFEVEFAKLTSSTSANKMTRLDFKDCSLFVIEILPRVSVKNRTTDPRLALIFNP